MYFIFIFLCSLFVSVILRFIVLFFFFLGILFMQCKVNQFFTQLTSRSIGHMGGLGCLLGARERGVRFLVTRSFWSIIAEEFRSKLILSLYFCFVLVLENS